MADELEILTAQFDADISGFNRKLDQLLGGYNSTSSRIEARNAQMISKLNSQFSSLSLTKLLGGASAIAIIDKLVDSSKALADQTLNVSKATGISAETVQGLGVIARKAGVDQDSLTTSLQYFSAQVGAAQLKNTDFRKEMLALGVDLKNGPEAALMSLSDQIGKLPKAQQDAIAKMATGRGGVSNLTWLTDGSKNIQSMIDGFKQMGLVVPTEKLQQVQAIFETWGDIKTEALSGFIDGFSQFAGDVESPAFQAAVKDFGKTVGDIAGFIVQMAPYIPQLLELYAAFNGAKGGATIGGGLASLLGPEATPFGMAAGAVFGAGAGYFGTKALLNHYASQGTPGAPAANTPPPSGTVDLSGVLDQDAAAKTAAYIARLQQQLNQQTEETAKKARDSANDMLKAHNDALIEMAKGTAAYYDVQKQAINDEAAASIQTAYDEQDAEIASIDDRAYAQTAAAKSEIKDATQQAAAIKQIKDAAGQEETQAATNTANKLISINDKKNQQLLDNDWQYQQQLQNAIQLNETLRDGIADVAAAGVTGFKSMKQAAADLLEQVAQLIIKLYVMQPLLNSMFGPPGTEGGGSIGSLIGGGASPVADAAGNVLSYNFTGDSVAGGSGLFSGIGDWISSFFADGGVFVPGQGKQPLKRFASGGMSNQAAIFGEAGPEAAVPLPDGRSIPVTLRMPQVSRPAASTTVVQQFDLSGAVVTQDLLNQMNNMSRNSAAQAVALYDKKSLPSRVRKLTGDHRMIS